MVPSRLGVERPPRGPRLTRRARVAGLLATAILLAGCGGGGSGSATHPGPATTVTAPATTSSGGSSVNVGIICSTPRDAALAVVNAWSANDRAAARRCGSPTALDTLFARAATKSANGRVVGWILQGCAGTMCSFTSPHATARLTMGGSDAAGWFVTRVQFGS